ERAGLPGHGVSAPAWRRSVTVGLSAPAEMDPAHLTLSVATGTHHSLTYSAPTEKTQGAEPGRRDRMRTGEGRLGQRESQVRPRDALAHFRASALSLLSSRGHF
ncbi:unnamed protein product, partial [Ixodes pacificus]